MTDAAPIADSAPAPAEAPSSGGAPLNDTGTNFNAPLGSQIPAEAQAKAEPAPAQKSLDDSIDRAIAKSAAATKDAAKPEAKAPVVAKEPAKEPQPRAEGGKFTHREVAIEVPLKADAAPVAPKPTPSQHQAPARFSPDAKAAWDTAPEPVRAEVARMERELSSGLEKYRASHDEFEKIRPFHESATRNGSNLHTALTKVVAIEDAFTRSPVEGIQKICDHFGLSPRDIAAKILGQTPEEQTSQSDSVIRELRQTVQRLEQQVSGVTQTFQQQREQSTLTEINKFAADNPRFEELSEDIAFFMKTGRAKDLPEAYALAERLNPAAALAKVEVPAASSAASAQAVQTDKGQKSINGAPSTGSTPAAKKRAALSLDESLDRAFGSVG